MPELSESLIQAFFWPLNPLGPAIKGCPLYSHVSSFICVRQALLKGQPTDLSLFASPIHMKFSIFNCLVSCLLLSLIILSNRAYSLELTGEYEYLESNFSGVMDVTSNGVFPVQYHIRINVVEETNFHLCDFTADELSAGRITYDNSVSTAFGNEKNGSLFNVEFTPNEALIEVREKADSCGSDAWYGGKWRKKNTTNLVKEDKGVKPAKETIISDYEKGRQAANNGNMAEALRYWEPLVLENNSWAMHSVGLVYARGDSVNKNLPKAFDLVRRSAELGHRDAQIMLSKMYKYGDGVQKDQTKSRYWRDLNQNNKPRY